MKKKSIYIAVLIFLCSQISIYSSEVIEISDSFIAPPLRIDIAYVTVMNIDPQPLMYSWAEMSLVLTDNFDFVEVSVIRNDGFELYYFNAEESDQNRGAPSLFFEHDSDTYGDFNRFSLEARIRSNETGRVKKIYHLFEVIDKRFDLTGSSTELIIQEVTSLP